MRLPRVLGGRCATATDVDLLSDRLEVGRVDAGAVSAQVVESQAIGDRTTERLIHDAMSTRLALRGPDAPVAVRLLAGEDPAVADALGAT
jgi:hypothetical protein